MTEICLTSDRSYSGRNTSVVILTNCWRLSVDRGKSEKFLGTIVLRQGGFPELSLQKCHQDHSEDLRKIPSQLNDPFETHPSHHHKKKKKSYSPEKNDFTRAQFWNLILPGGKELLPTPVLYSPPVEKQGQKGEGESHSHQGAGLQGNK